MADRCLGTNKDGTPCSAQPRESGYCMWHDPSHAAEREGWRRRGGENRSSVARARKQLTGDIRDLADVKARLMLALSKVEKGELEAGAANAMAALARAVVTVSEAATIEDLSARMDDLERQARGRLA